MNLTAQQQLPSGWELTTLGDAFRWSSGGTPKSTIASYYDGGIPWAIIGDLTDGVVSETAKTISEEGLNNSSAKWVEAGSVMVAMYGSIGKLGIAGIRMTTNQAIAFTKPDCCSSKYLFWYLRAVRPMLIVLGRGGTQSNISQTVLKAFPFILPPENERSWIVMEIEKQFTRLEAGVASLKRVQANLKRYRAAVLKAACEGRLVASDIRAWRRLKISEVGEAVTGSTPPTSDKENLGDKVPFFKPTDLDAGYNVREARQYLSEKGAKLARTLPAGAILVTCIGATIGKTGFARVHCATNQQINALVVSPQIAIPEWAFWAFTSPDGQQKIKDNASATTLPILNKTRFEGLEIPVPPLAEQTRIVAEIERRLSVVGEIEMVVATNLQRATRLRQSVLQQAFAGGFAQ